MKNEYRKYSAVMVLCFLFGGFALILYSAQMYSVLVAPGAPNMSGEFNNSIDFNRSLREGRFNFDNPAIRLESPFAVIPILGGIVLLLGGISIWKLTREKEITSVKEKLTSLLLLPEERLVIEELKKSNGSIAQSQLVRNTGLSKVKAHRIVNRLSAKGIVKKYPYGLTNKIVLEKEV
jgi:uncharacterized membrane protein